MLEIFVWCSTRAEYVAGMVANGLATLADDGETLIYNHGIQASEIGPIVKADGAVVDGHHVNLRLDPASPFGQAMTAGLPQTNEDGSLRTIFERTHVLQFVPGLEWTAVPGHGVPSGYKGPNGVTLYDASAVNHRANVWQ